MQTIRNNRAAQGQSILGAVIRSRGSWAAATREPVVPAERERRALDRVRSRFRDRVDERTREVSIADVKGREQNLVFLDGVERNGFRPANASETPPLNVLSETPLIRNSLKRKF